MTSEPTWVEEVYQRCVEYGFDTFPLIEYEPANDWQSFKWTNEDLLKSEDITGIGIKCGSSSGLIALSIPLREGSQKLIEWWNLCAVGCFNTSQIEVFRTNYGDIRVPADTFMTNSPEKDLNLYFRYEYFDLGEVDREGVPLVKGEGDYLLSPDSAFLNENGEAILVDIIIGFEEGVSLPILPSSLADFLRAFRQPNVPSTRDILYDMGPDEGQPTISLLVAAINQIESMYLVDEDVWLWCIWSIQDMAERYNWPTDQVKMLFGLLTRTCHSGEKVKAALEYRTEQIQSDYFPRSGLRVFIYLLEKSLDVDRQIAFRKKWGLGSTEIKLYSLDDSFGMADLITNVSRKVFTSYYELIEIMTHLLSRCIRIVVGNRIYVVIKRNSANPIEITSKNLTSTFSEVDAYYLLHKFNNGRVEFAGVKECNPLSRIYNHRLICSEIKMVPYGIHETDPVLLTPKERIVNIFPGFKGKFRSNVSKDEAEKKLAPLLHHIKTVLANDNQEHYEYIVRWLAHLVQHPRDKRPVLGFIGSKGCGKSLFTTFLHEKVIGYGVSCTTSGLDAVTTRFNSMLDRVMLYVAEELPEVKESRVSAEKFRHLITEKSILVEYKFMEPRRVDNYISFIVTSNHRDCLILDNEARRYALFGTSDKYVRRRSYFRELLAEMNQDMADDFITFLGHDDLKGFDIWDFPRTEAFTEMVRMTEPSNDRYIRAIREGEHIIRIVPDDAKEVIRNMERPFAVIKDDRPFIFSKDLKRDYANWCKEEGITGFGGTKFCRLFASQCPKSDHVNIRTTYDRGWGYYLDTIFSSIEWSNIAEEEVEKYRKASWGMRVPQ